MEGNMKDSGKNNIPSPETLKALYRTMLYIRRFEEKIVEVYGAQDMKTPVHLYIGEEAVAAGVCAHLKKEDYVFTTHRSHGHCLAKGVPAFDLYAEFYGKAEGCCRGKGGSMHPASPEHGVLGTSAIVGGGIPIAVGAALSAKMRKTNQVSVSFFGDGATEEGSFHESLNFASLKKLPVVFVCENNYYATNSPLSQRQPHEDIAAKAASYGIPGLLWDGNDALGIYLLAEEAIKRARSGEGPTLLEFKTYRWKGHVGPDCDFEKGCRPKSELTDWMERCPVKAFADKLGSLGLLPESEASKMLSEIDAELDEDIRRAKALPYPDVSELYKHVYYGGADAVD